MKNRRITLQMKKLSCLDAGCDCDYIAKGETEEDVMKDAAQHDMKEHGKTERDVNQMKDNLRTAIRTSSSLIPGPPKQPPQIPLIILI